MQIFCTSASILAYNEIIIPISKHDSSLFIQKGILLFFLTIFKGYGAQLFVGSSKINIFVSLWLKHQNTLMEYFN